MSPLSYLLLVPFTGAILAFLVGRANQGSSRYIALLTSIITLLISVFIFILWSQDPSKWYVAEATPWITMEYYNSPLVSFTLGIDGLSMAMVLLSALLFVIAVVTSFETIKTRVPTYYMLLLLIETGLLGVFISVDLFIFYIFWEIVLVPVFFLIGIWGGANRQYAALKVLIYTHLGSLAMFAGVLMMVLVGLNLDNVFGIRAHSYFDMNYLSNVMQNLPQVWQSDDRAFQFKSAVFILVFIGFAFKIPLVPFHTWAPDAYVEAPAPVSLILSGLLSKMGAYALLRIGMNILPDSFQAFIFPITVLAIISIFYTAFSALAQKNIKRLIAYSSISHMGLIVLGFATFTSMGIKGSIFQMISHGLIIALLFISCGMIIDRVGTDKISNLGGLITGMPLIGWVLVFASMASLGLPGLSGFIGELTILTGAFQAHGFLLPSIMGIPLAFIVIPSLAITAGYYTWMLQRAAFGNLSPDVMKSRSAVALSESIPIVILIVLIVYLGLFPSSLMDMANQTLVALKFSIGDFVRQFGVI